MSIRIPLALVVACAALVAGCGSSSGGSSSSAPAQSTSTPAASSSSAGDAVNVNMQNIAFAPTSVTVKKGGTVTWLNKDSVDHNVTATRGATFKSATLGRGAQFTWQAITTGTIDYVCTIHPNMTAKLIVQ